MQAALDTFLELKGLYYFRIPDLAFKIIIKELKNSKTISRQIQCKKLLKTLKGWPDNMCHIPLDNGYLLSAPIECKSATGKTHGKQKEMARSLNYLIPRSPEQALEMVNQFVKAAEDANEKLDSKVHNPESEKRGFVTEDMIKANTLTKIERLEVVIENLTYNLKKSREINIKLLEKRTQTLAAKGSEET